MSIMSEQCVVCDKEYSSLHCLRKYHYSDHPDHCPDSWIECPECGVPYKKIGIHISGSSCTLSGLSQKQEEIVTGSLMGDGCVNTPRKNARLSVTSITKPYLNILDEEFGMYSNGFTMMTDADSSYENANRVFEHKLYKENFSDVYQFRTIAHPELSKFESWYETGEKVFPESIEMTPTVLKHWYCGDGSYRVMGDTDVLSIATINEKDNADKLCSYFTNSGLPEFSYFDGKSMVWGTEESDILFDYMGEPLPGFKYKWPERFR